MNVKLTMVAVAALVAGGALAAVVVGRPSSTDQAIRSGSLPTTGKALIGGPFSLVDGSGKRVTDTDFRGRYLLVFFGYTFCPDVCPSSLQVISAAIDKLGPAGDAITPVLISIDPARDTPAKIGAYVKSFHPRFVGLTGSPEEIAAAVKAYRVYAKKVPNDANPADYTMDHSSIVYLMGPNGGLVAFSPETQKVDVLADQLRKGLAFKG
jgi:cytochrome oxidase Cu insertion factor (SCO1/SenC/PrrC family)